MRRFRQILFLFFLAAGVAGCGGGSSDGDGGGGGAGAGPLTCAAIFNGVDKGAVAVDTTPATGVIASPGIDCYSFQATAGTLYQFNLSNPAGTLPDADLRFISAASVGDLVTEIHVANASTDAAEINLLAPYTDTYLLGITGDYSITVEEGAGAPLAEFPRLTADVVFGTWAYGDPLSVDVSHSTIPTGTVSMSLVNSVTATISNGFTENSFATGTPSTTNSAGVITTWGDQRATAGADWVVSLDLADTSVPATTRYSRMSNWGTANVEQQDFDFPGDPGSNRYYYGYAPFGPGTLTMASVASSSVTCAPPLLTNYPTLGGVTQNGGNADYSVDVPVDSAATVRIYLRPTSAGFGTAATYLVGTNTSAGAETVTFPGLNQIGAGNYYLDVELEKAADANCKTFYIVDDVVNDPSPVVIPSYYYVLSHDRTNNETRFSTDSGFLNFVQQLTVTP